jgi:hypothetical protein
MQVLESIRPIVLHSVLGAAMLGVALGAAAQQDYPSRPIKIIVPSAAGGGYGFNDAPGDAETRRISGSAGHR